MITAAAIQTQAPITKAPIVEATQAEVEVISEAAAVTADSSDEEQRMSEFDAADAIQLLRTMTQHVNAVQRGMQAISHELERRALVHDQSKFSLEEFAAFSRINKAAREHPYGSEEYRVGLRQEKPTIELHYARNSHHPEAHQIPGGEPGYDGLHIAHYMGFLDIIEMVCDWRSAYLTYGSQGTWEENLGKQRERYAGWFTDGQWWLIDQVAGFLTRGELTSHAIIAAGEQ